MEDSIKLYEQIEAYLANKMEATERQLFEEKMSQDESLRNEVESFRFAQQAIVAKGRDEVKKSVDAAFAKSQTPRKSNARIFSLRRLAAIAAVVLFFSAAAYLWFDQKNPATPEELFVTHYELPVAPAVRSSEGDSFEKWAVAVSLFSEKKYGDYVEKVTPFLEGENFSFRNEGYLFLGLSQLELGKNEDAINSFEKVSRASSVKHDAFWYTALTYLKMNDLENAKTSFTNISRSTSSKKDEAAKILKHLEME